jgi:hypothetical protein
VKKRAPKHAPDLTERKIVSRATAERVRLILDELPKRDRDALRSIFFDEKEKDAICQEFGIERDYLRVLIHRTKRKFRELYEKSESLPLLGDALEREDQRITSPKKANIIRPPGSLLTAVSEFLFSQKTLERVVNPVIADLQVEYCEALAANRHVKAAWVRLRGYWNLFKAIGLYSIVKMFVEVWRRVTSV